MGGETSIRYMQDRILLAALPHVAFDGWTLRSLEYGAVDAGFAPSDGLRAFPGGMLEAVEHFADLGDRRMAEAVASMNLETMRIRDRIAAAVRARIEAVAPYREAARRATSFLAMPHNAGAALKATYRTVDAIWYAIGDRSADFSFYTKRALLAAVYGSTLLCWLSDESRDHQDTWAFLDRRIAGVMEIPHARARVEQVVKALSGGVKRRLRRVAPLFKSS